MKCLLDTCTFLWIIAGAKELSVRAREIFVNPERNLPERSLDMGTLSETCASQGVLP